MKKLYVILTAMLMCLSVQAQEVDYPAKKQMEKGNYEAAEKEISKALDKHPDDVMYLYAAVQLYNHPSFAGRDISKAYQYACKAKDLYKRIAPEEQAKMEKKGLNKDLINTALLDVCTAALEAAKQVNTDEAYVAFLRDYPRSVPSLQRQAKARRNTLAFEEAATRNTVGAYEYFIQQHQDAKEVQEAIRRRDKLAYEQALGKNTIAALQAFIDTYPQAAQLEEAKQKLYDLSYRQASLSGSAEDMEQYMAANPDSPQSRRTLLERGLSTYADRIADGDWKSLQAIIDAAQLSALNERAVFYAMMQIARQRQNMSAAKYVWQNAPGEDMQDTCWMVLHDIAVSSGRLEDITLLYKRYPNKRMQELQTFDETLVRKGTTQATTGGALKPLIRMAAPYAVAYRWLQQEIAPAIQRKDYPMALEIVDEYEKDFGDDPQYRNLQYILRHAEDEELKPKAFPPTVNSKQPDYLPVMTADGNTLYFIRRDLAISEIENIYYSVRTNGGDWQEAKLLEELSSNNLNEGVQAVSADGTKLIIFRDGKLYSAEKRAGGWSALEPLPAAINMSGWQCDAMITSDNRALLFAARKQVENELSTSENIFVSLLGENGEWGEPIDLGPTINTPGTDRSPFLHADMHTLYFSSQGHGSVGKMDVFKTTRLRDDSWTEWSEPVNLGVQVNTLEEDWSYKISTDGMYAYYSNESDIYTMQLPESMRPNAVATISGHVHNDAGEPVSVTIRWENLQTHERIGQSQTDPVDGAFYLVLPLNKNYGYFIDDDNYFPISSNIDLRDVTKSVHVEREIELTSYRQMIEKGVAVQVNNLFFPVNEWELLPESEDELVRIAQVIKKRKVRVEISGHTDSSGDPQKNVTLSRQRAESVRAFLIKQGCKADMLIAKGYGASRPIADNNTDEGKQQNRRVELKFVK